MHMAQLFSFTTLFIFAGFTVVAEDLAGSLCNTCTPICSSPPAFPFNPPPSPPAPVSKPPPSPNLVHHAPPPPRFYYFDSPTAMAPPQVKSSPPPAYVSLGGNNGSPSPPRFVYFPSTPAAGGVGIGFGPNNYPYPYYMYDSKGVSSSVGISWVLMVLVFLVLD